MNSLDLALWVFAIGLALFSAWLTLPRPVELDWERHLKLALITLIRGEVERAGGDADAWLSRGRSLVWYHPAGRQAADKLSNPQGFEVPVPALPTERALLEDLKASPPERRVETMFSRSQDEVLYDNPASWGAGWDLAAALGQGADWEALAAWSDPMIAAIKRRNDRVRWVLIGPGEALGQALGETVNYSVLDAIDTKILTRVLHDLVQDPADRLVLVVIGSGAEAAVAALTGDPALRDRVRAVVGLGADLGGSTADRLAQQFTHEGMDTELARRVPYFHLAFVVPGHEPLGEPGLEALRTRWPRPAPSRTGRESVEVIELGLLPGPGAEYPPQLLARALLVTVSARLSLAG